MILFDDGNTELGRALAETLPEGVEVISSAEGYPLSAFPSVLVDVPAYSEKRPLTGEDGEFLGIGTVTVPAFQEILRLPASWTAVQAYNTFTATRAETNPPIE